MTKRFAAFVITFRRSDDVARTVGKILAQSRPPQHVLVVDNAASAETQQRLRDLGEQRVVYHPMRENTGPAGAAAFAVGRLRDDGFEWILWGDDDNPPRTQDTLERLFKLIENHEIPDLGGVGAVGVSWDWQRGEARRLADDELSGARDVDAIGGGQCLLLNSRVLASAGLPNPELFFGLEEMEFCLRIRRAGYRLLVDGDLARDYRRLAGRLGVTVRRKASRRHEMSTLWRRYYNTRNYIYLMRRIFGRPDLARREAAKAMVRAATAWIHGLSYGAAYTRLMWLGVRDGYADRMGLTVPPRGYGEGRN